MLLTVLEHVQRLVAGQRRFDEEHHGLRLLRTLVIDVCQQGMRAGEAPGEARRQLTILRSPEVVQHADRPVQRWLDDGFDIRT